MSELKQAIDVTRDRFSLLEQTIGELNVSAEDINAALAESIQRFSVSGSKLTAPAGLGDALEDVVNRFATVLKGGDQIDEDDPGDQIITRLTAVKGAITDFDETASKVAEDLQVKLGNAMMEIGTGTAQLETDVEAKFRDNLESISDTASEKFEAVLGETHVALLGEIQEALEDTVRELGKVAEGAGELTKEKIEDVWDDLAEEIGEQFEKILSDTVTKITDEVIGETINQVMEDTMITQISAQVTAGLTSQLPQLTAAKYSIDAVKSLLDALP